MNLLKIHSKIKQRNQEPTTTAKWMGCRLSDGVLTTA